MIKESQRNASIAQLVRRQVLVQKSKNCMPLQASWQVSSAGLARQLKA